MNELNEKVEANFDIVKSIGNRFSLLITKFEL